MPGDWDSGELRVVAAVARDFYEVVPFEWETCCSLVSRVAMHALGRLGVACALLPCQLWYAPPGRTHVVGFTGAPPQDGRWDGHQVCAGPGWIIDAAVSHLRDEVGARVPKLVAGLRFNLPSHMISRHDLSPSERMWWMQPPDGGETDGPVPDEALVAQLGDALHARVRAALSAVASDARCCNG